MNEKEQVNEGYVIIESVTVGNARFVIGENPNNQAAPYVTWQANVKNDPNNFFLGSLLRDQIGRSCRLRQAYHGGGRISP